MNVTAYDKGLEKGLEKGLQQGLEQGMEKGQRELLRELLRDRLEERFPDLPAAVLEQLERLSVSRLRELYKAAFTAKSLAELGLESASDERNTV